MGETAVVFDIEKFAVHDGPGIRTVVFLKGCPLRCVWCHNPESQSFEPEILFSPEKCMACGWCANACPNKCHNILDGRHLYDRSKCTGCGKCAEKCYAGALELVGKRMTVPEVLEQVLKDKCFYENSGGGMTVSGGEPLANYGFTKELVVSAKNAGIHTAIETSGFAEYPKLEQLLPFVDLWLWDVKASPEKHGELIGVKSDRILDNLRRISHAGAKIHLRCPMIPGVNDSPAELLQIVELANTLKGILRIDLEPYHPLGEGKSLRLGRTEYFRADFADKSVVRNHAAWIRSKTSVEVYCP